MAMACRPGRNQSLLQEIYESKMYTLAVQLDFQLYLEKITEEEPLQPAPHYSAKTRTAFNSYLVIP